MRSINMKCKYCGKEYRQTIDRQKFCSKRCNRDDENKRKRQRIASRFDPNMPALPNFGE